MTDLKIHSCHNPSCKFHGVEGEDNIAVRTIFGKHEDIFLLYCRECGRNFSENRETIFSRLKTPREKVVKVMECLSEGEGVRATSRITGLHRDTVARIFRLAKDKIGLQPGSRISVTT